MIQLNGTLLAVAALVASDCLIQAQPSVLNVQNSASYTRSVAQGSLFVVIGSNLGPAQLISAPAYPLLTQLAGTSIRISAGNSTILCPMVYTTAGQIAAILPSNTPLGLADITVTYTGQ